MDGDEVIERAAAAVAAGYQRLDVGAAKGLYLLNYFDGSYVGHLAPMACAIAEIDPLPSLDASLEHELGHPEIEDEPAMLEVCEPLFARIAGGEECELLGAYFLRLARRMHELLGIPVLVNDSETPVTEQLGRQVGSVRDDDALAELDVLVSVPIDEFRTAAVFRYKGQLYADARATEPRFAREVLWPERIGEDPEVWAGKLPVAAVTAAMRDRQGVWDEAATGGGAWLCVLPHQGREDSTVVFRDEAGQQIELTDDDYVDEFANEYSRRINNLQRFEQPVVADAQVPALWLASADASPIFAGWEGEEQAASALIYVGGDYEVRIEHVETPPTPAAAAASRFTRLLVEEAGYTPSSAARRMREIRQRTIPGSIDGTPRSLALAAPPETWTSDGWAAAAVDGQLVITIGASGAPPDRVDFVRVASSTA